VSFWETVWATFLGCSFAILQWEVIKRLGRLFKTR
jgi:hypothetical protein